MPVAPEPAVLFMSIETIITITAAICEILVFVIGLGGMIYNQGTFRAAIAGRIDVLGAQTGERLKALTERFDLAHSQNNSEISELKQAVGKVMSDVSTLREDRIRLNRIEEEVRELRRERDAHRAPA